MKRQTGSSSNNRLREGHHARRREMWSFSGTRLIKDDDNEVLEEIECYQDDNSDLPMETRSTRTRSATDAGTSTSDTHFVCSTWVSHIPLMRLKYLACQFYLLESSPLKVSICWKSSSSESDSSSGGGLDVLGLTVASRDSHSAQVGKVLSRVFCPP